MKKNHNLVDVEATLIHETSKGSDNEGAYLINDGEKQAWVPKASCEKHPHWHPKEKYTFTMPEKLAQEKGFI